MKIDDLGIIEFFNRALSHIQSFYNENNIIILHFLFNKLTELFSEARHSFAFFASLSE